MLVHTLFQALSTGSSAIRFKEFVAERALFIKMNTVGFVLLALFGALTFVFDPLAVSKVINLMASAISAALVRRNGRTQRLG